MCLLYFHNCVLYHCKLYYKYGILPFLLFCLNQSQTSTNQYVFFVKQVLLSFAVITIVPQPSSEGSFSPSAIKVTWTLPSKNQGIAITGFYLHIKEKESSSLKPKALFENIITLANASQTSLVIRNLSVLTKYQVQMAAYSGRKVGNYSSPIIVGK